MALKNKYDGSYSDQALARWTSLCEGWLSEGKQVYVYFDNDMHGYAPVDARRLQQLLYPQNKTP